MSLNTKLKLMKQFPNVINMSIYRTYPKEVLEIIDVSGIVSIDEDIIKKIIEEKYYNLRFINNEIMKKIPFKYWIDVNISVTLKYLKFMEYLEVSKNILFKIGSMINTTPHYFNDPEYCKFIIENRGIESFDQSFRKKIGKVNIRIIEKDYTNLFEMFSLKQIEPIISEKVMIDIIKKITKNDNIDQTIPEDIETESLLIHFEVIPTELELLSNMIYPKITLSDESITKICNQDLSYMIKKHMISILENQKKILDKKVIENIKSLGMCKICYDDIEDNITILSCNHKYHEHCINTWLESISIKTCPYCTKEIK